MLAFELLERFHAALRALDLRIAGELNPGLSDAEMDALTEPLGFTLPTELRTSSAGTTAHAPPPTPRVRTPSSRLAQASAH